MNRSSEAAFQRQIEQLAALYGWKHYHAPDNRPSRNTGRVQRVAPGFPDLTLVRETELVFAELKAQKGRVSPAQTEWLNALAGVPGVETYIWRPSDFDEINARLSRGRTKLLPLYRDAA